MKLPLFAIGQMSGCITTDLAAFTPESQACAAEKKEFRNFKTVSISRSKKSPGEMAGEKKNTVGRLGEDLPYHNRRVTILSHR